MLSSYWDVRKANKAEGSSTVDWAIKMKSHPQWLMLPRRCCTFDFRWIFTVHPTVLLQHVKLGHRLEYSWFSMTTPCYYMSRPMLILRFAHLSLLEINFTRSNLSAPRANSTTRRLTEKKIFAAQDLFNSPKFSVFLVGVKSFFLCAILDIWLPFWRVTHATAVIAWDVIDLNKIARWPMGFSENAVVLHIYRLCAASRVSLREWQLRLKYSEI